jgi:hypothetical protein
VSGKEKSRITRADRPPESTVDELVLLIDKLIKSVDSDDDDHDCPTEKMEYLEDVKSRPEVRASSREQTERKRMTPPPLPPVDDTSDLEIEPFEDSLMPTQF